MVTNMRLGKTTDVSTDTDVNIVERDKSRKLTKRVTGAATNVRSGGGRRKKQWLIGVGKTVKVKSEFSGQNNFGCSEN